MAINQWTRDEIIIALYLYYTIPFQKVRKINPTIIKYAHLIGRTPASLNMKIGNLGRLDPTLKAQNISGLKNGSNLDGKVWEEFLGKWEELDNEFAKIVQRYAQENLANTPPKPFEHLQGEERITQVSVRIHQDFFRASVLAAYNNQCCITGLKQPELLIASHIKPWKEKNKYDRLNPQNGLCLNALHDCAFDKGFIGLDDDFKIIFSPKLSKAEGFDLFFKPFENQKIRLPERFAPDLKFIKFHREHIFQN